MNRIAHLDRNGRVVGGCECEGEGHPAAEDRSFPLGPCVWFAVCDREAVVLVSHPVLGQVPACARCAERAV